MRAIITARAFASAGRFSPLGPVGIYSFPSFEYGHRDTCAGAAMQKRWSLVSAAKYGLLTMVAVLLIEVGGILIGSRADDPWLHPNKFPLAVFVSNWIGSFLAGPFIFLVLASIRNLFVKNSN
jgi:hypothetical protein